MRAFLSFLTAFGIVFSFVLPCDSFATCGSVLAKPSANIDVEGRTHLLADELNIINLLKQVYEKTYNSNNHRKLVLPFADDIIFIELDGEGFSETLSITAMYGNVKITISASSLKSGDLIGDIAQRASTRESFEVPHGFRLMQNSKGLEGLVTQAEFDLFVTVIKSLEQIFYEN